MLLVPHVARAIEQQRPFKLLQSRSLYGKTMTRNRRELVQRAQSIALPLLDRAGRRVN